jgi:hypothetical protein
MNTKTTLIMAGALAVLVAAFFIVRPEEKNPGAKTKTTEKAETTKPLFADAPKEIIKMTVQRDDETLIFEKPEKPDAPGEYDVWRMVEPVPGRAVSWEVNSLADKIKDLKYVATAGSDLSAEAAGLDKPRAVITIADKDGAAHTVEIGKALMAGEDAYVRIQGQDTIYLADGDFKTQLKKKTKEYRDKDVIDFTTADAVRVEIKHDGQDVVLVKADGNWAFESPFKGPADQGKISSMLNSINSLRADEWVDGKAQTIHGFESPALAIRVRTEKKIEKPAPETDAKEGEEAEAEKKEPEVDIVNAAFEVQFGNWADISEQNKIFFRLVSPESVGVATKSNYENLVPKLLEWRLTNITQADTLSANKIDLNFAAGDPVALSKADGTWKIEATGQPAEVSAVDDLLRTLKDTQGTKFIDGLDDAKAAEYGFDKPAVEITLAIEGKQDPERIQIGAKSPSGMMGYVRRAGSTSVAVVKAEDLDKLSLPAAGYRDRQMLKLKRSEIQSLDLIRDEPLTGKTVEYAIAKDAGQWTLTKPADATLNDDAINDVLADVTSLRAKLVVGQGDPAQFGLDKPAVRLAIHREVTIVSQPPATQPASQPTSDQAKPEVKTETQSDVLLAAVKDGKAYAQIGGNDTIYEIDQTIYDTLLAELHELTLWKVETSVVVAAGVKTPSATLAFTKADDAWTCDNDPDVAVDKTKVEAHVKAIVDLAPVRFVEYAAADLAAYQLDAPETVISLTLDDKTQHELLVAQTGPDNDDIKGKYAVLKGTNKVVVIKDEALAALNKTLADFVKSDDTAAAPAGPPGGFQPGGGLPPGFNLQGE